MTFPIDGKSSNSMVPNHQSIKSIKSIKIHYYPLNDYNPLFPTE
jgi:hypothetical protein